MTAVALGSIPVGEKFCRLHSRESRKMWAIKPIPLSSARFAASTARHALLVISDVADAPDRRAQISGSSDDLSCPEQKIHVDGVVQPSLAVVLRSEAQGQ
jgi:hypothetical protein